MSASILSLGCEYSIPVVPTKEIPQDHKGPGVNSHLRQDPVANPLNADTEAQGQHSDAGVEL